MYLSFRSLSMLITILNMYFMTSRLIYVRRKVFQWGAVIEMRGIHLVITGNITCSNHKSNVDPCLGASILWNPSGRSSPIRTGSERISKNLKELSGIKENLRLPIWNTCQMDKISVNKPLCSVPLASLLAFHLLSAWRLHYTPLQGYTRALRPVRVVDIIPGK